MFKIAIDVSALTELVDTLKPSAEKALQKATAKIAQQTHEYLLKLADEKLKTTKEQYIKAVELKQEDNTWIISLDSEADWIEEGQDAHSLLPGLLRSPKAKQGKNGKYINVPFKHSTGPSKKSKEANDLTSAIKREMKSRGINFAKVERGPDGKAKLGLLHSFNISGNDHPVKTHEGPGMGHGAIGKARQGHTGIPFLQGVRVYQKLGPRGGVQRGVFTFRTASEANPDKWKHPGSEGKNLFPEAEEYANTLVEKMYSEILSDIADQAMG